MSSFPVFPLGFPFRRHARLEGMPPDGFQRDQFLAPGAFRPDSDGAVRVESDHHPPALAAVADGVLGAPCDWLVKLRRHGYAIRSLQ